MGIEKKGRDRAKRFGHELKLARIRADVLQTELADMLKVHATSVSQWERGDRARVPDFDTVSAIDDALDAGGVLLEAAGYREPAEGETTMIPIPLNLTSSDVALLLEMARRLSDARRESDRTVS